MIVKVEMPNKIIQSDNCYTRENGVYEVEPTKITRIQHTMYFATVNPKYDYTAHFIGIDDMKCHIYKHSVVGKECQAYISKAINPEFDPSVLEFVDNVAVMGEQL